ncbi:MAG: translocation/assembly module TamB domain-containing protein [bacterium]|nr:MAG: translocation/assembly module TamB domain-containing protein [bacterium]
MQTRRWILIIALFVAFTALVIYHGWNLLRVNERIKKYVIIKLSPALGGEFEIDRLDMSLGAVHLKDAKVRHNDFLLKVDDIRIGFNFTSLVKNSFRPQRIPHDIIFIKPHLTLQQNFLTKSQKSAMDSLFKAISYDTYWEKIKNLDFIKRVTISKGKISYIDSINQHQMQLAHDINGRFSSQNEGLISARLAGKLFHSQKYNFIMTASIDIVQEHLDFLDVKVKNYEWKEKIPIIIPDYFDIKKGTIDGIISLVNKESDEKGFNIQGEVSINNGAMQVFDNRLYFDDINIKTKIKDLNCIIEDSGFLFNGSYVDVAGKINNVLSPQLDLTMKSKHFDLKKNINYVAPKTSINLKGYSTLLLHVTNTFNNPTINGKIVSPQLTINDKKFYQVKTIVSLEDSTFKIKEFSSGLEGLNLIGNFDLDFSRMADSVFFSITSTGELFAELVPLPFRSLKNNISHLQIQGRGNLAQVFGTIDFRVKTSTNLDTTFQLNGDFEFGGSKLSFHLNSASHHFMGEGFVLFSGSQPKYHARLAGIHNLLYSLPELKIFQKIFNYKTSIIQIQGEQSNWRITGRYAWNGRANRTASMTCRIRSQNDNKQIAANINIYSSGEKFYGNLNLIKTRQYWEIKKFDIENLIHCNGRVHLAGEKQVEANVVFPDVSLPSLGNLIVSSTKSIDQGKLYGFIGVSGTLAAPKLSGNLNLTGAMLNQIGLYDGDLTFQLVDEKLVLNELNIIHNQQSIFKCDGTYALDTDQLNFNFLGQGVDLNSMVTTILNKPGLLEGKGSTDIKLRGNLNRPILYGKVDMENGKLGPFSFNHILLDLGEDQHSESSTEDGDSDSMVNDGVILNHILLTRIGQFEMQGQGVIPFSHQKPVDIELKGMGNILSLLPELTPFIEETKSNGEWTVNFTGRPKNLIVSGGRLVLSEGYLRLGDVAPEIKNINANMELEQDGFLNVKFISGNIRGKPFKFRNFRSLTIETDTTSKNKIIFEPFAIPELNLDFGIFNLETTPKGIPLHIPGLMAKGEIGQFFFTGKADTEQFYFAGPLEQPVVRGKLQLQNVNFTFPFIRSNSINTTKKKPVVEVLKRINWDIAAIAGKDLHYLREIPSGVDNVYVDLIVNGGLEFKGVINDNSFGVTGQIESSRGNVEYLDLDFQVVKAGVEFDMDVSRDSDVEFDKSTLLPIVYGEARTTVTDSTGYPYYVYLTLLTVDKLTGHTLKRGRLGEVVFQLSADNPNLGYTEGELLASLGYSASNIPKMATDLIGISTDNLLFRPLFRPFERQLERTFRLDMVRFSSRFTRNLIEMNLNDERNFQLDSKLFLLRSTKLMIGKYLAERLFLLYTGQLEAGMDYRYQQEGFGFRHTLGLEYRINPSLLLQMEYDYNSLLLWQKEDKKFMLRHSFPF